MAPQLLHSSTHLFHGSIVSVTQKGSREPLTALPSGVGGALGHQAGDLEKCNRDRFVFSRSSAPRPTVVGPRGQVTWAQRTGAAPSSTGRPPVWDRDRFVFSRSSAPRPTVVGPRGQVTWAQRTGAAPSSTGRPPVRDRGRLAGRQVTWSRPTAIGRLAALHLAFCVGFRFF